MGFIRRKAIETNVSIPHWTNDGKMGGSKNLINLTKVTQLKSGRAGI